MNKYGKYLFSLAAVFLLTVLAGLGALRRVDKWAQDWFFQKPGVSSGDIIIIGIDEDALAELGPYHTWSREVIASVLEKLSEVPEKKPAVTAVDILYAGSSSASADSRLAEAAGELGNVVTASMAEFGERINWENGRAVSLYGAAVVGYEQPYEELRLCTEQGHINIMPDKDGIIRHALLYVEPEGKEGAKVFSMAGETARIYLEQEGRELVLPPVDRTGHFYIPYTARPGNYYDGVSVAMVLSGKVPPDYWAGKIVLIGPYAAALQDAYFTSVDKSQPMYGVEIQANLIQSFLEGNFRTELPDLPQLILLFLLCTAAVIYFLRAGVVRGAAACTGLIALYLFIAYILYKSGLIIHLLWLPCCLLLLYLLALVFHYIRAAEERQQLALEKERISTELALASRIQKGALVKDFPPFPERKEFELYASMNPAKEVGGDFYDFFLIDDDHLGLVIADVSGKGSPAALFMMVSMALVRHAAMSGGNEFSPAKALQDVNRQVCSRNPEEMFVTVWLGILEISTGKLTAANAGHEYPVLKRADGNFELIKDKHGLVIGAMEMAVYRQYELQLEPGAKLFVYTDGVAEALNEQDELFGTARMVAALRGCEDGSPEKILETVGQAVKAFAGSAPQADDLTMLCLQYNGSVS